LRRKDNDKDKKQNAWVWGHFDHSNRITKQSKARNVKNITRPLESLASEVITALRDKSEDG
jgi:hypothetical protein